MGGYASGSKSQSDSSNQNQFNQQVWGGQQGALKDMYGAAGQLFGQTNEGMQQQIPGAVEGMQAVTGSMDPNWQKQMQGGAYEGMDLQGQFNQAFNAGPSTNEQDINAQIMGGEGNNYADAMRNQYTQDATRAQENMLQNLDARAAASGMSGGSRQGVATAMGMEDINKNLQGNMAKVGYETFSQDLDRKLGIARQADTNSLNNILNQRDTAAGALGQQQQAMQSGLGFGQQMQNSEMGQFSPYNAPWQSMGNYSQAIGSPAILGSGSGSGQSSAKGLGTSTGGGIK